METTNSFFSKKIPPPRPPHLDLHMFKLTKFFTLTFVGLLRIPSLSHVQATSPSLPSTACRFTNLETYNKFFIIYDNHRKALRNLLLNHVEWRPKIPSYILCVFISIRCQTHSPPTSFSSSRKPLNPQK